MSKLEGYDTLGDGLWC